MINDLYYNHTQVNLEVSVLIKKTGLVARIITVLHPTIFEVQFDDGQVEVVRLEEVRILKN